MVLISRHYNNKKRKAVSRSNTCIVCSKSNVIGCKCIINIHGGHDYPSSLQTEIKNCAQKLSSKISTKSQNSRIGCIIYDDDCFSNKDVTYRFLTSRLEVKNSEYIIQLPVREDFRSIPATTTTDEPTSSAEGGGPILYSGPVFINNIHPIILPNTSEDDADPISHWRLVLVMRRGYHQNYFDAHISLSCVSLVEQKKLASNNNRPPSAPFFVKLELQVLNHFGQVHITKSDGDIQTVSEKMVARYHFPHFISLQNLQCEESNLLKDCKTLFKVILTYATGYSNNDVGFYEQHENSNLILRRLHSSNTLLSKINTESSPNDDEDNDPNNNISILTQDKYFMLNSNIIQSLCPLLAKEIKDNLILMETFSSNAVQTMIHFLQSRVLKGKNVATITDLEELIQLAHRYDLPKLKNLCFDILVQRLKVDTAAQAVVLCMIYDAPQNAIFKIKEFVLRNGTSMKKHESTTFYAKTYPLAFIRLMFGPLRHVEASDLSSQQNGSPTLNEFFEATFAHVTRDKRSIFSRS